LNSIGLSEQAISGELALFPPARLAKLRVAICYLFRHQRMVDFDTPATFTELVQRRKLECRDQRMVMMADKVAVKSYVSETLGIEWVIPTLWQGTDLPETPEWALPVVLKSRHGCNQNIFFREGSAEWLVALSRAKRWLNQPYGRLLDEWLYAHIPRGFLVEPFVGEAGMLPVDYKIYTFGGSATHIQVHLDRESRHRWILFDRNWRRVSAPNADPDPAPPSSLDEMLSAAEKLGCGFDFVRTDFYEVRGKPLFGEMTFYPGSGLDKFHPASLDSLLGKIWLEAGGR
jgi:TupA-like ATPgrasp